MINPEPGKFYKTHSGEKAHVLGFREDDGEYPIVGCVVYGDVATWTKDGLFFNRSHSHPLDLIEEWVELVERTFWVNVYPESAIIFTSKERADCIQRPNRQARVKVTCTEGQWDA